MSYANPASRSPLKIRQFAIVSPGSSTFQFLAIHPCGVVSSFSALDPSLFTVVPTTR